MKHRQHGRTALFLVVALGLGGGLAATLFTRGPVRLVKIDERGLVRLALSGLSSDACVTTVQACLEGIPGVTHVTIDRESAVLSLAAGAKPPTDKDLLALVRATGHDLKDGDAVEPCPPPLTSDETAKLDALRTEWVDVRLTLPPCTACAASIPDVAQRCPGVKEVVVVHWKDHLAVRRDLAATANTQKLAQALRAATHAPVTIDATKTVSLRIDNMTCNRCIGSIRGILLRTPGVLSPTVELGSARVVTQAPIPARAIAAAVETAPGPACKGFPQHVFKAHVTDDGQPRVAH